VDAIRRHRVGVVIAVPFVASRQIAADTRRHPRTTGGEGPALTESHVQYAGVDPVALRARGCEQSVLGGDQVGDLPRRETEDRAVRSSDV
jgi:hypothetical protein